MRDLTGFNGKMVAASGMIQIRPGSHEGSSWFAPLYCPVDIKVKGVDFGNTITLTPPSYPAILFDHKIDFGWDPANISELVGLMSTMDARTEQIHAIVVGLFETRVPTESLVQVTPVHPEGARAGYGHMAGWAAQIVVKTITDMRIEKKPEPKSPRYRRRLQAERRVRACLPGISTSCRPCARTRRASSER